MTGQPDFAHIVIDYVPQDWLVESKSLKLYLHSFRNHGQFHEDCTMDIGKRLVGLLDPEWLRIGAYWYPRGGIPIDVVWQTGAPPEGVWLPDQGVAPYRGRGQSEENSPTLFAGGHPSRTIFRLRLDATGTKDIEAADHSRGLSFDRRRPATRPWPFRTCSI